MGKKGISHRKFSIEFKLSVLSDYFQSNQSEGSICRKYQLSKGTILRWEKEYVLAEKALPLSSELLRKLEQMRTLKETSKVSRSREEKLEDGIMRLRKALEYSELRNEALHEVLKIGREQFGIDLLKKSWRQAVNSLRQRHPGKSLRCLCGLFGKTREGYYSVNREEMEARILLENNMESMVQEIRKEDPGIGAYKLFLMLKDIYGKRMFGRDRFYKFLHQKHLMLPAQKRRHTTNSNHNYRKYKNQIKGYKPDGINKLWVADITYIDTDSGVCYLHLLTDAFSHEIIGWSLSESLMAEY